MYLNTTGSKNDAGLNYANVATSSVFYMGVESGGINTSGDAHIAYCFAPVEGYCSIGKYVGNGSASGPMVYTGFRPRWIMVKGLMTSDWMIVDTTRATYNSISKKLYPNQAYAENGGTGETDTTNLFDHLSNGFKLRSANTYTNQLSTTYVYLALAEHPFQANGGLAR